MKDILPNPKSCSGFMTLVRKVCLRSSLAPALAAKVLGCSGSLGLLVEAEGDALLAIGRSSAALLSLLLLLCLHFLCRQMLSLHGILLLMINLYPKGCLPTLHP